MTYTLMAVTSSLVGFFYSLGFGAVVLGGLGAFFIYASQTDPVNRR
ncbi:photosystem II reaction center protein PsbX [Acaryochloris thomasi]